MILKNMIGISIILLLALACTTSVVNGSTIGHLGQPVGAGGINGPGGRTRRNVGGCYSELGEIVNGCICDESCATCGYNDSPTGPKDCITCADGKHFHKAYDDGTGFCDDFDSGLDHSECSSVNCNNGKCDYKSAPCGTSIPVCNCHDGWTGSTCLVKVTDFDVFVGGWKDDAGAIFSCNLQTAFTGFKLMCMDDLDQEQVYYKIESEDETGKFFLQPYEKPSGVIEAGNGIIWSGAPSGKWEKIVGPEENDEEGDPNENPDGNLLCNGRESCCTPSNPCGENDGDCDMDSDCRNDLRCGVDNCPSGQAFDSTDDCCFDPQAPPKR